MSTEKTQNSQNQPPPQASSSVQGPHEGQFSSSLYKELKEEFNKVSKRILKDKISTNPVKLEEYELDIKASYTRLSEYASTHYESLDTPSQAIVRSDLLSLRDRLTRCFARLGCKSTLSAQVLASINEDELDDTDSDDMAPPEISQIEFLKTAGSTLPNSYSGDPLALEAFVNSVELMKIFAGNTHAVLLKQIVIAKLVGKALESVPQNANSIDEIIDGLRASIKPDNSKVIAGRMMALRTDKNSLNDFTKQAEDLADALKRSFIAEGISQKKAQEMVIEKTVEMCRSSAKTDLVKSILAASSFNDPKEVVAKFVVESATEAKEKQVLHFGANGFQKKKGRDNYSKNGNRRGNYSNGSKRYNNRNNRYGRGKREYSNDKGRNGYSNNNNYRNVRYAENSEAPSQDRRGTGTHTERENGYQGDRNNQWRSNEQYSA